MHSSMSVSRYLSARYRDRLNDWSAPLVLGFDLRRSAFIIEVALIGEQALRVGASGKPIHFLPCG